MTAIYWLMLLIAIATTACLSLLDNFIKTGRESKLRQTLQRVLDTHVIHPLDLVLREKQASDEWVVHTYETNITDQDALLLFKYLDCKHEFILNEIYRQLYYNLRYPIISKPILTKIRVTRLADKINIEVVYLILSEDVPLKY